MEAGDVKYATAQGETYIMMVLHVIHAMAEEVVRHATVQDMWMTAVPHLQEVLRIQAGLREVRVAGIQGEEPPKLCTIKAWP